MRINRNRSSRKLIFHFQENDRHLIEVAAFGEVFLVDPFSTTTLIQIDFKNVN